MPLSASDILVRGAEGGGDFYAWLLSALLRDGVTSESGVDPFSIRQLETHLQLSSRTPREFKLAKSSFMALIHN
jgi:hypothetical protein